MKIERAELPNLELKLLANLNKEFVKMTQKMCLEGRRLPRYAEVSTYWKLRLKLANNKSRVPEMDM